MNETNRDIDKHELEKIRLKKMRAMMEAKKRQESAQERGISISEKINYILSIVLAPDAYNRLNNLKINEPHVYQFIYNELISHDVIESIDYLLAIIRRQGGVPRRIPLDVIVYLERKAKGIRSKIQVQRGDDIMDLSSFLSKGE